MELSIAMMVKNEEENLERCLNSLQKLRDAVDSELILVDTGSEDNTVEIAKRYTDKVYFHPWNNDFSTMRNITIDYAKGKWILIIDADEEIQNVDSLINFLRSSDSEKYGALAISCKNIVDIDEASAFTMMTSFRLFKNDGYFHYEGAVHNQPMCKGEQLVIPEVMLLHYGYIANDSKLMEKKFIRTSQILKNELEKDPNNIYYWAQLSSTYGMHEDFEDAIECIERAYALMPKERAVGQMFIFIQMALSYRYVKNYLKVEEVCLEAIAITENYIDIYYYLAEAQALMEKYKEAIINYEKYLELLKKYDHLTERDTSVIEYSIGYDYLVYYNLSNLCKLEKKYTKALYYAEQIKDEKSIKDNFSTIIFLYLTLNKCSNLRDYYDKNVKDEWKDSFFGTLDVTKNDFDALLKLNLAKAFCDVTNPYSILCKVVIDDENGVLSEKSQKAVDNINVADLPIYCSDVFYYLLKMQYPLERILNNFKEIWISCILDYIAKHSDDLSEKIYHYLQQYEHETALNKYKLSKVLCRCTLLLDQLDDAEYQQIFQRYIEDGAAYLQVIYSSYVIDSVLAYEMKNDEEVFLLYMYHAQMNKEENQSQYIIYLRKALQAFPGMKRGIEMLSNEIQNKNNEQDDEFTSYKTQVKMTIKQLMESGKMDEAKSILTEYKSIVPNDMETILLESKILLNQVEK